jgi:hypothetical protein
VACLLRAGLIDVTAQGKLVESALSVDTRNIFTNNNTFRSSSFRPKQAMDFAQLVLAAESFKEVFGTSIPDISSPAAVATAIRQACVEPEENCASMHTLLVANSLPGASILLQGLDQTKVIRTTGDEQAILAFNGAFKQIKEAVKRASDLSEKLTEPALATLRDARTALRHEWVFLKGEPDLDSKLSEGAAELEDLLARETFFLSISAIGQHAEALRAEHQRLHAEASAERAQVYVHAIASVKSVPGWEDVSADQQQRLLQPLTVCAAPAPATHAIPLIRADVDACPGRTQKVIEDMLRLIDGARIVRLSLNKFFSGAIETKEQLDGSLDSLRQACEQQIAEGKKVFIQ